MAKMKTGTILLIIGIIIAVIFLLPKQDKEPSNVLQVSLYDANKNLIRNVNPSNIQSVVGGISGVSFIGFTVTATNDPESTVDLNFNIQSLTQSNAGTQFRDAMLTTYGVTSIAGLPVRTGISHGSSGSWSINTANLIPVAQWEGQTIIFTATVGASFGSTTLTPQSGQVSVQIESEGTGTFSVTVTYQTDGTATTTLPAVGSVLFRTTDSTYSSGSAVGWNLNICGSALRQYGYAGTSSFDCATSGSISLGLTSPEGYIVCGRTGYTDGSGYPTRLYVDTGVATPPFYTDTDADRTQVSTSPTPTGVNEVTC